jgi:hypothetical protein
MAITITSEYIDVVRKVKTTAYKRRVTYKYSEGEVEEIPQTPDHIQAEKDLTELLEKLSFDE